MKFSVQQQAMIAISAAMIAIMAQITIPIPVIPLTLQTLAIGLVASIFPWRQSIMAVFIYILLGAIGLPVFAGFKGGLGVVFGPTGGFLISFIGMAFIISYYLQKTSFSYVQLFIANTLGMLFNLLVGTIWLKWNIEISWISAFQTGFTPFLFVGIVKVFIVCAVTKQLRSRIVTAKLLVR